MPLLPIEVRMLDPTEVVFHVPVRITSSCLVRISRELVGMHPKKVGLVAVIIFTILVGLVPTSSVGSTEVVKVPFIVGLVPISRELLKVSEVSSISVGVLSVILL